MKKLRDIYANQKIKDVYQYVSSQHRDERGITFTLWSETFPEEVPSPILSFKEDKIIIGYEGSWRGLHGDDKTWKLFYGLSGDVDLFLLDLRKDSPTYLNTWIGKLGCTTAQILVPPGVANGHLGLSSYALLYKWSQPYTGPENQFTIKYNDPRMKGAIDASKIKYISDRDKP